MRNIEKNTWKGNMEGKYGRKIWKRNIEKEIWRRRNRLKEQKRKEKEKEYGKKGNNRRNEE